MGFFGGGRTIQGEPGPIVGPIAMVFGYIVDFIFNFIYNISVNHSLGFSIIFLTIFVRLVMVPLAIKQQKSMLAMQRLNPEIQKIRDKYGKSKDPEMQRKMNVEIQSVYTKNKVNPLGGCLPMFVQMPLFFGLSFIMHQSHLYVTRLGSIYTDISQFLIENIPHNPYISTMNQLALPYATSSMIENREINLLDSAHVNRVLNVFGEVEWAYLRGLVNNYAPEVYYQFSNMVEHRAQIENFFGMTLTAPTGVSWPGIMIPILAVITTMGTSWVTQKMNVVTDERVRMQQKIMMTVMPVMMGVMTVGLPAGVGIFWITGSVFHIVQQIIFNNRSGIPLFEKPLFNKSVQLDKSDKK